MFYREHGLPHFHAEYQGQQATFTFDGNPLAGTVQSRTAVRLDQGMGDRASTRVGRQLESADGGRATREDRPAGLRRRIMDFLPTVIRAEYRGEYRIHLAFTDGVENTVDFSQWLDGPVFEPLKEPGYFQRFFLEGGTVTWPNGADVAPETLYERAKSSEAA